MNFDALMETVQRLNAASETLAVIGAELRLRLDGADADPVVRTLVSDIIAGAAPGGLEGISAQQLATALAVIQSGFQHALDLLDNPARKPGWAYHEPAILQTIGRMSTRIVHQIDTFASQRPALRQRLSTPGTLLDIGTGVGWLAIEAARVWPTLNVVGIDIWEPSLKLARANIAGSDVQERVTVQTQDLLQLSAENEYSFVWYPGPFIPGEIAPTAMANAYRALAPGGWMIFGIFPQAVGHFTDAVSLSALGG